MLFVLNIFHTLQGSSVIKTLIVTYSLHHCYLTFRLFGAVRNVQSENLKNKNPEKWHCVGESLQLEKSVGIL